MVSVTLEHVTKTFGEVQAVQDVSLNIRKGELFFILGPSGCGKTTLLRMIAGFYPPTAGRILFDDRDMSRMPPHRRNTGMVFQNYALWPHMSVWENVAYGLNLRKVSADEKKRRVEEALEIVRMAPYADRSPNQLSGGQQQRVALARALVINPDVVLLDEPLSNLDAKLRLEMRHEIRRIHDDLGATMVYVTHDQKEALSMADRMAVMGMGVVQQIGDPRTIYNRPANTFVADFIGETNFIPGTIADIDDGYLVETPVGRFHSRTPCEHAYRPGDRVTCSVRPESIRIETHNGQPAQINQIDARVTQVIYLGECEQYTLILEDKTTVKVIDHHPERPRTEPGETVRLVFSAATVVILDQA